MLKQLVLIHRPGSGDWAAPDWLEVKTCLRSFWLGFHGWDRPELPADPSWEVLEGLAAYRKLVEIGCGLHSPVLGETEVFGQIRKACSSYRHPDPQWQQVFQRLVQRLYTDVKRVRTRHLTNLGAKSYGSYARKYFKGADAVRIFGTGQLAREILPWLAKSVGQILIHSRRRHPEGLEGWPAHVQLQGYDRVEGPLSCGLLVAAPLSAQQLHDFVTQHRLDVGRVLDLREESATDPLVLNSLSYESLGDVFESFEKNKAESQMVRELALKEVGACLQNWEAEAASRRRDNRCAM